MIKSCTFAALCLVKDRHLQLAFSDSCRAKNILTFERYFLHTHCQELLAETMYLLQLRTAIRIMKPYNPQYAFSTMLVIPCTRSPSFVSFSRPLRSIAPKRYLCSNVSNSPSPPLAALKNRLSDNGAVVTTDFEDASVLDSSTSLLSSDTKPLVEDDALGLDGASAHDDDSPFPSITHYRLSPPTIDLLSQGGITHFTEVQAGTFDLIYDGKDIIAKSRTGTGKTLAFALPIMERLALQAKEKGVTRRRGSPSCIVLAPTRELAKQVAREMNNIGAGLGLSVHCFYGGSSYVPQETALREGFDVLVGTPGRIIDHLDRGSLRMHDIQFAVLDEADEMLSMGFAQDIERIFEGLPPKDERQVILFSATVPSWVKGLAAQFQNSGVVTFDAVSTGTKTATTVRHCAVRVPEREEARAGLLADIIAVHSAPAPGEISATSERQEVIGPSRAIVFTQTKREADELATSGALDGCGAAVLHGDVSQRQREITLSQFRKGQFQVLVATDVAARGLDISGVDVVVQYRIPMDSESYIHRAGRTGRAGKNGTAVVMYSDREAGQLHVLERECRIKFEQEAAPAPERALEAAVDVALANIGSVEERVRKHLIERAEAILEASDDKLETIASLLAMAGRRIRLADRSVLSGEIGMRTLLVRPRVKGSEVVVGKALRFINDIGKNLNSEGRLDVGLIRTCKDGSAVVDVMSDQAVQLLEEWGKLEEMDQMENYDLKLELAVGVPALNDTRRDGNRGYRNGDRGRGGDRRRGDMRGAGSYGRDRDRRRGDIGGWRERGGGRRDSRFDRNEYGGGRGRDRGENMYGRGEFGGRRDFESRRGGRNRAGDGGRRNDRFVDRRGRRGSQFLEDEF